MRWDPVLAVEFLTVVRVRRWRPVDAGDLARAQAFYPLVGLGIGGCLVGIDAALSDTLPPGLLAAVLVAALAAITRGLHLDGLADTFDGLLGGRDAAHRLEIMRDPRLGSFGVAALVIVVLLKWSAVAAITPPLRHAGLLAAPALARYAMVVGTAAVPYARPDGMGAGYHAAARGAPLLLATVTAAGMVFVLFGAAGLTLLAIATVVPLAVATWARRRIGGATGDIYGAICELTETAILVAIVAARSHGWLDTWLLAR